MTLNPASVELEDHILRIATKIYGERPRIERCRSEVNYCVRLGFSNGSRERVIKIANRDPEAIEIERVL